MDLDGSRLSEMSDGKRKILYDVAYMWNLKKTQQTSVYNIKAADSKGANIGYQWGKGRAALRWESDSYKLSGVTNAQGCTVSRGE